MSRQQTLPLGIVAILAMLFLVGCGGGAPNPAAEAPAATSAPEQAATSTPESPAATSTPEPPPDTPTPEPPTATPIPPTPTPEPPTPVPPTATPVSSGPKAGLWEGEPSVSFTVTEDGQISEFKLMTPLTAGGDCTLELNNVAIEENDTFVFSNLVESKILNRFSEAELEFFRQINSSCPYTPIETDSGEMIEAQNITGEFGSNDKVTGTFLIQVCEEALLCEEGTWSAEWKEL